MDGAVGAREVADERCRVVVADPCGVDSVVNHGGPFVALDVQV
jgi:hypothetical protein